MTRGVEENDPTSLANHFAFRKRFLSAAERDARRVEDAGVVRHQRLLEHETRARAHHRALRLDERRARERDLDERRQRRRDNAPAPPAARVRPPAAAPWPPPAAPAPRCSRGRRAAPRAPRSALRSRRVSSSFSSWTCARCLRDATTRHDRRSAPRRRRRSSHRAAALICDRGSRRRRAGVDRRAVADAPRHGGQPRPSAIAISVRAPARAAPARGDPRAAGTRRVIRLSRLKVAGCDTFDVSAVWRGERVVDPRDRARAPG